VGANTTTPDATTFPDRIFAAATSNTLSGVMKTGAQVRLVGDSSGLRFVSQFDATAMQNLKNAVPAGGKLEFGTLICPSEFLVKCESFTMEALDAKGVIYANVKAQNGIVETADGSTYIRAAIVNINPKNYTRIFAAVGYARITDHMGRVVGTYYTAYSYKDNCRSVSEVAAAAINDSKTPEEIATEPYWQEFYTETAYTVSGGALVEKSGYKSPYTKAQLDMMLTYVTS